MLAVKPHLKYTSASRTANQLMAIPLIASTIQELVAKREEEQQIQTLSSRETLIKEAEEVRKMAKTSKEPQLKHMLGAIDLKGRLSGAFDQEQSAGDKIQSFIGKLQINNTQLNVHVDKSKQRDNVGALPPADSNSIDCIDVIPETSDKIHYVKYDGKSEISQ